MNDFKEFQAKNLDQAIQDACSYFGSEREKLEIEIIEDAKMGVFGIIGARKAKIRARKVSLPEFTVPTNPTAEEKRQKPFSRNQKTKRPYQKTDSKFENLEKKAKFDKLADKPADKQFTDRQLEDDEEGESQKRFLSKMQGHHAPNQHIASQHVLGLHDEEELDEHELEAMDREAMQRANFLGNMTEAEIIASGHYEERSGRYQRNNRHSRFQPRHEYRDRNEQRPHFEKSPYEKSSDTMRDNGFARDNTERHGKYRKFDRQDRPYRQYKNDGFDRNDRSRFDRPEKFDRTDRFDRYEKFDKYEKSDRFDKFDKAERNGERKPRFQHKRPMRPHHEMQARNDGEFEGVQLPKVNLLELEQEKLLQEVRETITKLVSPIVGDDAPIEITVEENRILIKIESEDSGLLIGREGQHLAAIQYLAARILTIKMQVQIRIQLDTGDYHQRQDERMQSLALMLADRVRKTGRSQSTRPMSAYQRRVIHLALQEEDDVQTRSVGDGVLKRVIIMKKREYSNHYHQNEYTEANDAFENQEIINDEMSANMSDVLPEDLPEDLNDDIFADDYADDDYDDPYADENCDECDFPNENDFDEERSEVKNDR